MPCLPFKVNRRFGGTCRLHLQSRRISQARNQYEAGGRRIFTLVSCLAYYSKLKIEATCSSKTSVDFQWTTRRYIPKNRTLQNFTVVIVLTLNVGGEVEALMADSNKSNIKVTVTSSVFCTTDIHYYTIARSSEHSLPLQATTYSPNINELMGRSYYKI
jgi:hypothetical protein